MLVGLLSITMLLGFMVIGLNMHFIMMLTVLRCVEVPSVFLFLVIYLRLLKTLKFLLNIGNSNLNN